MDHEISAKILPRIFSEISEIFTWKVISSNFLRLFRENYYIRSQYTYEILEINIRLLHRSACLRVEKNGDNRRSFVVEEGPPPRCAEVQQCVHAYLETSSAWRILSRTEQQPFAPHHRRLSMVKGRALYDARLKKKLSAGHRRGRNDDERESNTRYLGETRTSGWCVAMGAIAEQPIGGCSLLWR